MAAALGLPASAMKHGTYLIDAVKGSTATALGVKKMVAALQQVQDVAQLAYLANTFSKHAISYNF